MRLYKHQQELVSLLPKRHLLAWEVGTGKTVAAIKCADKQGFNILVVCPKSIKDQWIEEISKFSDRPEDYKVMTKEEFRKYHRELRYFNFIIIDECHNFANYKSQLHKSMIWYLNNNKVDCVYGLTGTPYMANVWSIYGIAKILGRDWNWMAFKREFFNDIRMGSKIIPVQKKNIEAKVAKLVKNLGSTVRMDQCFDIPEQVFEVETFDLTNEQKKAIEKVKATEVNHITKWTKCHCISNGVLNGDGYTEDQYFKSEKTQRIIELCKDNKKIAIVARYKLQLKLYKEELEKLGKTVFIIDGDNKDRHGDTKKIHETDECVVLIQSQTCEGYSLETVPIMIFASYDFSLKNYIQVKGRLLRANAVKKNVYISLVNKEGIDKDVYHNVVEEKQDFQLAIYNKISN